MTAFERLDRLAGGLHRFILDKRGDGPVAWRACVGTSPPVVGRGPTMEAACQDAVDNYPLMFKDR